MIQFDRKCSRCSLSMGNAVGWFPKTITSDIKLITISDYPGYYEVESGIPLTSNQNRRWKSNTDWLNAGALFRKIMEERYCLDVNKEVYITNAIKCDPRGRTIGQVEKRTCFYTWLSQEMKILDEYLPEVPLLIAGQVALEAVAFLYKVEGSLNQLRGKVHKLPTGRPAVYTFNPVIAARGMVRLATGFTEANQVSSVRTWMPPVLGSPLWFLLKDLEVLDEFF